LWGGVVVVVVDADADDADRDAWKLLLLLLLLPPRARVEAQVAAHPLAASGRADVSRRRAAVAIIFFL